MADEEEGLIRRNLSLGQGGGREEKKREEKKKIREGSFSRVKSIIDD